MQGFFLFYKEIYVKSATFVTLFFKNLLGSFLFSFFSNVIVCCMEQNFSCFSFRFKFFKNNIRMTRVWNNPKHSQYFKRWFRNPSKYRQNTSFCWSLFSFKGRDIIVYSMWNFCFCHSSKTKKYDYIIQQIILKSNYFFLALQKGIFKKYFHI